MELRAGRWASRMSTYVCGTSAMCATDEHLDLIGVDRGKLGLLATWRSSFEEGLARPVAERTDHGLMWEADGEPIGFSTADRIVFGDHAYMHLHLLRGEDRHRGYGTELVRRSARTYVEQFELERLYCEPHAFNVAPNRDSASGRVHVRVHAADDTHAFERGAGHQPVGVPTVELTRSGVRRGIAAEPWLWVGAPSATGPIVC